MIDGATVIWDSLAIIEYLAEQIPKVWSADVLARAWSRCAAAEMHSEFRALRHYCTMNCGLRVRLDSYTPELEKDIARLDELWCEGLTRFGEAYLAGQSFTAVDAFFASMAFRVQTYDLSMSPEALADARRLLALPSMQEWYAAALRETWRDKAHEEMTRNGKWLHDYRAVAA